MNQMANPGISTLGHAGPHRGQPAMADAGPSNYGNAPGYGYGYGYGPGYGSGYGDTTGPDSTPEFVEYWRAIMLRKWYILGAMVVLGGIAAYVVSQMKPVFRSTATALIESTKSKVVGVDEVYSGGISANREYFQTQAESMKSREIADRVIRDLKLATLPEFDPNHDGELREWFTKTFPFAVQWLPEKEVYRIPQQYESAVVREFMARLTIEPVRLSQLVKVSFDSEDPQLAARVANSVVQAFVDNDSEQRSKITLRAGESINDRLGELKTKLDASERAVQAFREREGLIDSKGILMGGAGRQLDDMTRQLSEARVRTSEAEEAYNLVKSGQGSNYESVPAVVRNSGVQRAREIEADAQKKVAEVGERYGPDHPEICAGED